MKTIKQGNYLKSFLIIIMILLLSLGFPAYTKADTEDDLNEVEEQAEEARTERALMEEELVEKQGVLDGINDEIYVLQLSIDEKQEEIYDMEARIMEMQNNINEQKGGLGNRLRNMYKGGSISIFDVLLNSSNVSEFLSNLALVQRIYDSDQKTLMELEEQHRELEQILYDMEVTKEAMDAEMSDLSYMKADAEIAKAEVEEIIDEIQARIDEYEAEAARLEEVLAEEQAELERQRAAAAAAAAAGGGDETSYYDFSGVSDTGFAWPCSGPLTSYYGPREAPGGIIDNTFHLGIDIGVGMYSPIYASKSGYVSSTTGWYGSYGLAVLINHDGGYSTLYGHNSEILVGAGQFVEQGQLIAYSGSTGWSTGPHCHFEIRINGATTDPLPYLP